MTKKRIAVFLRSDNKRAQVWKKKITDHVAKKYPSAIISDNKPQIVIALGGDGTILEAARTYRAHAPIILGLNLGRVGFLASARTPKEFLRAVDAVLSGKYKPMKRMMLRAQVWRKGKMIHETDCLNEVTAQGLMSPVRMTVSIDKHPLQYVHGSGVIISTPTGSTAYNLSAHGPIVTPDINCMIITELLDHNIPTPSIVVKRTKTIRIDITEIRERKVLALADTGELVDAVLTVDDMNLFPLREKDHILVTESLHIVHFAEFEDNYFFKSLEKKFAFR